MDTKKQIKNLAICAIACYALCSCGMYTPRVYSHCIKKYPKAIIDSVKVFKPGDTIPNSSEVIGIISIRDSVEYYELTNKKGIELAKDEVAKCGGNGFAITSYITPSHFNNFYEEIDGAILHITDMNIYPNRPNPSMNIVSSSYNCERYVINPIDPPKNSFSFNIGLGRLRNVTTDLMGRESNFATGVEIDIRYDRIIGSGIGFGLEYSSFKASNNCGDLSLTYFAPSIIFKGGYHNFFVSANIGFGGFGYKENSKVKFLSNSSKFPSFSNSSISKIPIYDKLGWGCNSDISFEYRLSKHFGLSSTFGGVIGHIRNNDIPNPDSKALTYLRVRALLGLKVYL